MPTPADPVHLTSGLPSTDPVTLEQNWRQTPQLLAALKAAQLGAWCWDMESGDISWSEGSHALFGLPATQTLPGNLNQLSALPFDDWPKAQQAFDAVIKMPPRSAALTTAFAGQTAPCTGWRYGAAGCPPPMASPA